MPTESDRLRRPLGARDRRLIAAAACAAAASAPAALLVSGHHAPPASCTTVLRAGFMGGETVLVCDNRRKELTPTLPTFTLESPMSPSTNASKKSVVAFVARIRLR